MEDVVEGRSVPLHEVQEAEARVTVRMYWARRMAVAELTLQVPLELGSESVGQPKHNKVPSCR
jgi:hypothetical protein